jgi:hypothetical protein
MLPATSLLFAGTLERSAAGYDDDRYVHNVEQLIAEVKKNAQPPVPQAAPTAEQQLKQVWDAIPVQPEI